MREGRRPEADVYVQWLGIAPGPRPPDHYALLGLPPFEADSDMIRQAARDRLKKVRPYCLKFQEIGTRLLNEIASAQVCLLDPAGKAVYDRQLASKNATKPAILPDDDFFAELRLEGIEQQSRMQPDVVRLEIAEPEVIQHDEVYELELDEPATAASEPLPDFDPSLRQKYAVGIELGIDSLSIASVRRSGDAWEIPLPFGGCEIPAVACLDGGVIRVGSAAVQHFEQGGSGVVKGFPWGLGGDPFVFPGSTTTCTAENMCAGAIRSLVHAAEDELGPIGRAVFSVPLSFTAEQMRGVKEASRRAGLHAAQLIPDPVAACLGHAGEVREANEGFDNKLLKRLYGGERNVLVIDIGELSFEACLLTLGKGAEFQVLAAATETDIAGQAFDAVVLQVVCDGFKSDTGRDPRKDPKRMRDLRRRAIDARDQLTRERRASVEFVYAGEEYEFFIKRDRFEAAAEDLLDEVQRLVRRMLKRWRLTWDEVDRIILVGPYARLPMVARLMTAETDGEVAAETAPEHAKAKGAALYFALHPTGP